MDSYFRYKAVFKRRIIRVLLVLLLFVCTFFRVHYINRNIFFTENLAFFPRGLSGTGLALRTGDKIIRLDRSDPFIEESDIDFNSDEVIRGK